MKKEGDQSMKLAIATAALATTVVLWGCKAGTPGKVETSVTNEVKHEVTIGGKDVKNPIPYSADVAKEGQGHFGHHCQICHGLDGQGTGVPFANKMQPPVADLAAKDVQDYTDGQLKWIIENGIAPSGMPGWKGILEDDEMWKIVHFIRHLPAKGSLGEPAIFKEESEEHQNMEGMGHEHHHDDSGSKPPSHKH
jgi:mono/diheme cytochrome c family protein